MSDNITLELEQEAAKAEELADKPYLVTEIFGPTIQGEGLMAGKLTVFVRLHLCDFSCSWCLVEGTGISTPSGRKRIEDIQIGDTVYSYNEETGEIDEDKVTKLYKSKSDRLLRVKSKGKKLFITPEHPVYVPARGGWIKAEKLKTGDEIYHIDTIRHRMLTRNPMKNPETAAVVAKKVSAKTKGKAHNAAWNKAISIAKRLDNPMWDPEVSKKNSASHKLRPTSIEKRIIEIAKQLALPLIYSGDGSKKVNGRSPDFLVKGQDKVIEVYDPTYPRKGGLDKYLKDRPKSFKGYKTLMLPVSANRLKTLSDKELGKKLSSFVGNGLVVDSVTELTLGDKSWARYASNKAPITVYNFETKKNHNYFANHFLVHNCDTKYTWQKTHPDYNNYSELLADEIVDKVDALYKGFRADDTSNKLWVTISGGNPALQLKNPALLDKLSLSGYRIQIETQGTVYRDSFDSVDLVVVSPKPPSSAQPDLKDEVLKRWIRLHDDAGNVTFKIVVFDKADFDWMYELYKKVRRFEDDLETSSNIPFTLQVGTTLEGDPTEVVLDKYRELVDMYLSRGKMPDIAVLPQVHVLIWGRRKGV